MKKIIILTAVLAALVGAALYQQKARKSRLSTGSRKGVEMREMLVPDLDVNSIQKIRIKDAQSEVNVALNGTAWTVAERGGYEASFDHISRALLALKEQKISRKQFVGKEAWAKVGVQPPGEPTGYGIGTLVELLDSKGNIKKSLVLGGNVTSSGNPNASPFGGNSERLVRMVSPDDGETIWTINNTFADLESKPEAWLDKAFFDVQKVKSVEITAATPADSWKASRPDAETTDFTLEGAKPGEKIDAGKVSLATLLSSPTFNDVLAKDKAADALKGAVKAKIVTFEGFTYSVQAAKQGGKDGTGDKYYLSVSVSADLPKARPAVKDEKEEDKKKNDAAFAEEKKKLEDKLAAEKKLEGWVYDVSEYTVSNLLKKRSEILAEPDKNAPPAAPEGAGATAPGLPDVSKMLQGLKSTPAAPGLTQPSSPLPETPKPEIKPAPAPGSNPVTGEKPASPAKPEGETKK
ncbi:DUF4340 domain-containing protein [Prosthecobacter sp.]|uniref:DUF4340 domain-containing protein n=1 Tax=Prosthecobacter sp. TaxID=1965333 RepID=UPI001DC9BB87|nr:DUF4340 domain-containing protein [Prosthecobacter sp.]MCB1275599.1 DUF4340 domain-containing protein [Prosthecobacter sp.]